jgi:hypothetical protein
VAAHLARYKGLTRAHTDDCGAARLPYGDGSTQQPAAQVLIRAPSSARAGSLAAGTAMTLDNGMAITLIALRCLALDPGAQARFWAEVLDVPADGETVVVPGFSLRFVVTDRAKTVQARIHFDLTSSSGEDRRAHVARVLRLGGQRVDIGQDPAEGHVVLSDPEGNELCVIPAGNQFLADTGRIGAVNCDGTHALGVFWSRVLDWPLVWDEGDETAIQSPDGGSKFTWSGPPLMARDTPERISFQVAAQGPEDLARLVRLGATALGGGRFLDPDGNEFIVAPV